MNARALTAALGGRWHGSYGMCACPSHQDGKEPALKVSDDPRKSDGIDVHCFAGCAWRDVKAVLRERGLIEDPTQGIQRPRRSTPAAHRVEPQAAAEGVITLPTTQIQFLRTHGRGFVDIHPRAPVTQQGSLL